MNRTAEPPMIVAGASGTRRWVRIAPTPGHHLAASHSLILQAAGQAGPGAALVLGAGRCQEIPLAALADRFEAVTLVDHDEPALLEATAALGACPEQGAKVRTLVADLTGVTGEFLRLVSECLDTAPDPSAAAARLAHLAETTEPRRFGTGARYSLVVASCVLCQLHLAVCNLTLAQFGARYPDALDAFRQSRPWVEAMSGLARRLERAFLDALYDLTAPEGRIYLSDTVQGAYLHAMPEGDWMTDGVYRMTRTTRLADDLNPRFRIEREGRWHWIIEPKREPAAIGRLFNVQGLILSIAPTP